MRRFLANKSLFTIMALIFLFGFGVQMPDGMNLIQAIGEEEPASSPNLISPARIEVLPSIETFDRYRGKLAFSSAGFIRTVNLETGEHLQYAGVSGMGYPRWSSDGRYIYFEAGRIYRIDIIDETIEKVTQRDDVWRNDDAFIIDPTQNRMLFQRVTPDFLRYHVLDLNTMEFEPFHLFASGRIDMWLHRWSRDGQTLVFEQGNHLFAAPASCIETRDCEPEQITSGENNIRNPAVSPDGQQFVYIRSTLLQDNNSEIFVIDADGSNERQLTDTQPPLYEDEPAFSPDGQFIVYDRIDWFQPENQGIFIMRTDGSEVTQIVSDGGETDWWMDPADLE